MEMSKEFKGKVIGQFLPDLWKLNFIHTWEKPDCISEIEFLEESKIFQKSISFKTEKFPQLRGSISEELSKIGELSHFIIEGGKIEPEVLKTDLLDDLLNSPYYETPIKDHDRAINEPVRVEKKVGRNEPCPCDSGKKYKKCCGKNGG